VARLDEVRHTLSRRLGDDRLAVLEADGAGLDDASAAQQAALAFVEITGG
jgi:hypothetical protein